MFRHIIVLIPSIVLALGVLMDLVSADACIKTFLLVLIAVYGACSVYYSKKDADESVAQRQSLENLETYVKTQKREQELNYDPFEDAERKRKAAKSRKVAEPAQRLADAGWADMRDLQRKGETGASIPVKPQLSKENDTD